MKLMLDGPRENGHQDKEIICRNEIKNTEVKRKEWMEIWNKKRFSTQEIESEFGNSLNGERKL
jgi:hypothetical protein